MPVRPKRKKEENRSSLNFGKKWKNTQNPEILKNTENLKKYSCEKIWNPEKYW